MRKTEIEVFKFDELEPEIKEKVLNKFRENNDSMDLNDNLTESLKYLLGENKIKIESGLELYYSLSYSQGDGLKFLGKFKYKNYYVHVENGNLSNYYQHKKTTDFNITTQHGNDAKEEIYTEFKELYYSICDKLEKEGYQEIEYQESEEAIKETIDINDYEFYKSGEIF